MLEYLTAERATLVLVAGGYVLAMIRWVAPQTETKIDDEIVAGIDRAKQWAERWSPTFWAVVEKLGSRGGNVQKAAEFARILRAQYLKENGAELPLEAEAVAENIAANLSATTAIKVIPANPRPAPGDLPQ